MNTLSARRFGQAVGGAFALTYLGCALIMAVVPHDATVRFFNSLMHGLDVSPIVRWDIPLWETVLDLIAFYIFGWLFGAVIAILFRLRAPQARFHSARTFSWPRKLTCRKPSTCFIHPKTGSTVPLPYAIFRYIAMPPAEGWALESLT